MDRGRDVGFYDAAFVLFVSGVDRDDQAELVFLFLDIYVRSC